MKSKLSILTMGLLVGTFLVYSPKAIPAEPYFAGKTIRLLVGFSPGGGTDLQARYFAANWPKFIPGRPRLVVTNLRPQTAAANFLHRSKPNGLTLMLTASSMVSDQFLNPAAKYQVDKFPAIGTHLGSSSIAFVSKNAPYKRLQDAIGGKEQIIMGTSRPDSGAALKVAALAKWLNIPVRFIHGMGGGTSTQLLAIERGDTNMWLPGGGGTVWYSLPTLRPGWFKNRVVEPFAVMGPSDLKIQANVEIALPKNVKNASEFVDRGKREAWDAYVNADSRFGKILFASPGTPKEVMAVLDKAYRDAIADEKFQTNLAKLQGQPVELTTGAKVKQDIKSIAASLAEHINEVKKWKGWALEMGK